MPRSRCSRSGGGGGGDATAARSTATPPAAHGRRPPRPRRRRPTTARPGLRLRRIGTFDNPVYVTAPPGDRRRVFVVEQGGTCGSSAAARRSRGRSSTSPTRISSGSERGLLSLAFAPDYASSGLFYVYYTAPDGDIRIVEYRRASARARRPRLSPRRALVDHPASNHNGGLALFGPDGLLYAGPGDGGGGGDQHGARGNGQNRSTLLGKILRIDPRRDGSAPLPRPDGNPYAGRSGGRPEIYAYGLRNPWRFSFTAERPLVVGDVGQGEVEEVTIVRRKGAQPRLARVGGPEPLRLRRVRPRPPAARHPALPLRRQLLDHRRRGRARPGPVRAPRPLRVRRPLPRPDRVRRASPGTRRARGARHALEVDNLSSFGEDARAPRLRDLARRPGLPARPSLSGDLADHDVTLVRADNPSPLTLTGTNTWSARPLGHRPGPGARRPPRRGRRRGGARGGAEGIAVTHDHADHVRARRAPRPARRRPGRLRPRRRCGRRRVRAPARARAPGHSDDHLAFVSGRAAFVGDAVLGEGSVFVSADLAATSTACGGCASSTSRCCAPVTATRSGMCARSSTATSRTGSTASGACWRRSSAACGGGRSARRRVGRRAGRAAAVRRDVAAGAPGEATGRGPGLTASATRRRAISIAAAAGSRPSRPRGRARSAPCRRSRARGSPRGRCRSPPARARRRC